jgi:hypothetical protein
MFSCQSIWIDCFHFFPGFVKLAPLDNPAYEPVLQ